MSHANMKKKRIQVMPILINFMKLVFYRYLLTIGPISIRFNLSLSFFEAYYHLLDRMIDFFDCFIYCFAVHFDTLCTIFVPIIKTLQSADINA